MTCIVNVSFSCKADTQHVRVSVAKHFAFNGQHREQDLDERAEPRRSQALVVCYTLPMRWPVLMKRIIVESCDLPYWACHYSYDVSGTAIGHGTTLRNQYLDHKINEKTVHSPCNLYRERGYLPGGSGTVEPRSKTPATPTPHATKLGLSGTAAAERLGELRLRACYAMSGTDIPSQLAGAPYYAVCSNEIAGGARIRLGACACGVRY
eukprot:508294-Rhodomonas_salina.5